MGKPDYPINVIGTRHGEKRYESLLSREEMFVAVDMIIISEFLQI